MDPRPAADFLRDILKQAGSGKSRRVYLDALESILGEELSPHFEIVACRKGRLIVELDSAPLYAELSGFRREEIRLRINELVPDEPIAELTFRLGGTGRH
ncbi:MAG: DUF721 domain-containing protein [Planctomycetota bacterium]